MEISIRVFLMGVLIIIALGVLVFIYSRLEEKFGSDCICILVFLVFASFYLGNIAIKILGL